jgi:hypothetical protein
MTPNVDTTPSNVSSANGRNYRERPAVIGRLDAATPLQATESPIALSALPIQF